MTEKKQHILESALKLFSKEGYEATSTRSIAQEAGVSEGLIFRHFQNKEGLLKYLLERGLYQIWRSRNWHIAYQKISRHRPAFF